MTVSPVNASNAGMYGISSACTIFMIVLVDAIREWWKRKTAIIQIANVLQIFIDFINISYNCGFTLFLEVILLLKARALFPNPKSGLVLLYVCSVLIALRLAIGIVNIVQSPASLSPSGVCFTNYDPFWNLFHALYRCSLDLFLALLFVFPVLAQIKEMPTEGTFAYTFYSQLLKDVSYGGADAAALTQFLFCIQNVAASVSIHMLVRGVKRAHDRSRSESEKAKGGSGAGESNRSALTAGHMTSTVMSA
ncbi:hypothetical protein HDU76_009373 [Blyttiomyces sp. JEL0837]|nr:hypothetical protein HDU76_009373 [Blyttiomyces sp. JEL0837]